MKLRWRELLLSALLAVGLWYGVTGSEKFETQLDIRVDYRGTPEDIIVYDGLVSKVSARVRASRGQLRAVNGREYLFTLDLSGIIKGENVLPIPRNQLPLWGGVELMDVSPSRLTLRADILATKEVPVQLKLNSHLSEDYQAHATLLTEHIILKGPSEKLKGISSVTVEMPVLEKTEGKESTQVSRVVTLPEYVTSTPAQVNILLTVAINRQSVTSRIPVTILDNSKSTYALTSNTVTVTMSVPQSQATPEKIRKIVQASVKIPERVNATTKLPVIIDSPSDFTLLTVEPQMVYIKPAE